MVSASPENVNIPHVDGHEHREVFATYGQTLSYAQSLEAILKCLVCIYNCLEKGKEELIDDETLEKIFAEHDHSTLGKILKALECRMEKVDQAVKEKALQLLSLLREARNSLAHSYLITHGPFMESAEGRSLLIVQLRHYSRHFKIAADCFKSLLEHLLNSFIGPAELQEKLMTLWNLVMAQAVKDVGLDHFRAKLESAGAME